MVKLHNIDEILTAIDWSNKTLALIGRGKENNKYIYNDKVVTFCVNDSVIFYPNPKWTVIIEGHWIKNFPPVNGIVENVCYLTKSAMKKYNLIAGCTPSLFLSFVTRYLPLKTIYMQGFSMDGISPPGDPHPYDWDRQVKALSACFNEAIFKGINIGFVTYTYKMQKYRRFTPSEEHILKINKTN